MDGKTKKIIIHSPNWVGDTIMAIPTIEKVRKHFPKAHISLLAKEHITVLLKSSEIINDTITLPETIGIQRFKDENILVKKIRKLHYDIAIILPNSFESALRIFRCGIKKRIGYAKEGRSILLTHKAKRTPEILNKHTVHYYLNLLHKIGIEKCNDDSSITLALPKSTIKFAEDYIKYNRRNKDGKIFAFGIGSANNPRKRWNPKYYKRLARILSEKYNSDIILLCSEDERELARDIAEGLYHKPLIPESNLIESAALISKCDGFVGNDSGTMHLASAVNIPTIGLFFATSPKNNYPMGSKCYYIEKRLGDAKVEKILMKSEEDFLSRLITAEEVIEKMKEIGLI